MSTTTTTADARPHEDEPGSPRRPGSTRTPDARPSTARSLRRLWPYVKPEFPRLTASAVATFGAMLSGLMIPLLIQRIVDGPIANGDTGQLWVLGGLLLFAGLAEAVLFWLRRWLVARPATRVQATMREDMYRHLQRLPVAYHDGIGSGQLLSRAISDLSTIRRMVGFSSIFLVVNSLTFVTGLAILFALAWQLALVVLVLSLPLIGICLRYETRYRVLSRRSQDQVGDLATTVEESILGVRILKAFGRSAHLGRGFRAQAKQLQQTELAKARMVSVLWATVLALPEIAIGICLLLGVQQVAAGTLTAGALIAFFTVAMILRWPVDSLGWMLTSLNDAATATDRFFEVMDQPVTITSPNAPVPLPSSSGAGTLEFDRVSFRFHDAGPERPETLREVSLRLDPGRTVAVVGATGSGKTALTGLVNRVHDVTGGRILLDGVDIRDIDLVELRTAVSVAFEEPVLFSASVRENITLGRPGSSDEDVERAIDVAQAGFVRDLPWGLATRVGEHGLNLSGGQRQRLGAGSRGARQPSGAGAGRSAVRPRRAHRGRGGGSAAQRPAGHHRADHRPPGVDGVDGGPGRAARGRPDHRIRGALGTARHRAGVPPAADQPGPRQRALAGRGSTMSTDALDSGWQGIAETDVEQQDLPGGLHLRQQSRELVRSLLRPHRRLLWLTAIVVLADQAVSIAGPLLIAYAIDTAVPALIAGDSWPLTWTVGVYLAAALGAAGLRMLFIRMSARISQRVLLDLRGRVFDHAQALSVSFHESYTSGRVISRLTSDLDTIADALEEAVNDMVIGVLSVVAISGVLIWLDPALGLIAMIAFLPMALLTRWFQRRSKAIYDNTRTSVAALIVQFVETLNGLRAVQAFRRERRNRSIFDAESRRYAQYEGDALVTAGTYSPAIRLIGNVTLTVVMLLGAARAINGTLDVGILAALLLYLRRMYDPMDELAMFYNLAQSASAALDKIATLLAQQPSVPEPAVPVEAPPARGAVTFDGVRFGYSTDREVLAPFDLVVPAGQTVALVGATGAGKSTLAKLMARFYDPAEGRVLLDGVDLRDLATPDLRRGVVMVTQESFLFSGSVADNIALGNPAASRAEVEQAAAEVGADRFVRLLPAGFDTDVRKRGGRLSAGQRQLVAFARAFLADPAVLILDEATASLDIPSERAVQAALQRVLHGRTALIIAHRLSTVAIADRVLVMENGRIVEDGSPAELIAGSGRFAALNQAWRDSLA